MGNVYLMNTLLQLFVIINGVVIHDGFSYLDICFGNPHIVTTKRKTTK